MSFPTRGFHGRRRESGDAAGRIPPGQHLVDGFPVLSAGPTPHTPLADWTFSIRGGGGPVTWTWEEFRALPTTTVTVDIHCVTKWSKLDTVWEGVSVDTLLETVDDDSPYLLAFCDGGYTTNLAREDVSDGKAWVAYAYRGVAGSSTDSTGHFGRTPRQSPRVLETAPQAVPQDGEPLEDEHGGPARLLVPHLYFWKSAKWVRGFELRDEDEPGFWESNGYHIRGDPWLEQRYWGD